MVEVRQKRALSGKIPALKRATFLRNVDTRLLILNADPVFEDRALTMIETMEGEEKLVVRTLAEAVSVLIGENFDAFVVEGPAALALEQATNARQHFPSLKITCLLSERPADAMVVCAGATDDPVAPRLDAGDFHSDCKKGKRTCRSPPSS